MNAATAAEAYTCPKCGERSTKGQLSGTGFHCPRCTLELAHLELAPNGTVRQVLGWLRAPGDLVQGRYRVTSVLGKGGFAATYLVTDERLQGKRRALKELPRDLYDEYETMLLTRLRHPAIPDISDRFEVDGMVYLVLEFGGTQSLEGVRKTSGGTIAAERLLPWMRQLCEVLAYLHGQTPPIVHRDLKPENILLEEDNRIMLIDFGIAKESADLAVTRTLARSVSHGFSPPEQVLGTGTDQRSDVYALGATMYALLTGTVPLAAHERVAGKELAALRTMNPAIPEALEAVILQTLDLNLNRRPQTIAELSRIFAPGTLDARAPAPGLGTRTVRVGEQMPLPAQARASIRVRQASVAPPAAARHGRRALWIAAGGLVAVAAVLAAWRLLEPSSSVTPSTETPAAPVVATPAVQVTPTESSSPSPPAPAPPTSRSDELGPAGQVLKQRLGKKPTAPEVAPNSKRTTVAVAPSPPRPPSTPPAKTRAARNPVQKVAPPLDLIDKVHER
ncbi:MAG: protein kinase domain-containing protein [Candidatus Rokuibacteriota bacterium]